MGQHGQRRTSKMSRELGGGDGRIAVHARVDDGLMFVGGDRQRARHTFDVEPAVSVGVVVQLANGPQQPIAGMREQREVEFAVDGLPLFQVVAGDRLHAPKAAAQRIDVALGEARHVDADGQRLMDDAHRVELFEIVDREGGDASPAVHFGLDEPFALQHADGFAERSAAHAELAGELDLRERFTRRQRAIENGLAQAAVDGPRHVSRFAFALAPNRFGGRAECRGLGWERQEDRWVGCASSITSASIERRWYSKCLHF